MTTKNTTDSPGFTPLVYKFMAAKTVMKCPNRPETYKADAVFVMSPKSALAVQQLSAKEAGNRITSIEHLRMPYKSVVVEMPMTPEVKAMRTAVPGVAKVEISRVAARMTDVEIDGVRCVSFWPFWEFEDGTLGFGAVTLMLASGSRVPPEFKPTPGAENLYQCILPASPLIAAAKASGALPQTAMKNLHQLIYGTPGLVQETLEEITPLMFMWESVINCKSGITATKVVPRATGKVVLGRRKKIIASAEYTVISLSAVECVSNGQTNQRADVEAHMVRGHFKKRKHGVYWWSPFIRGTGELKQRKGYIMKGAPT